MVVYWITAGILLAYLVLVWFIGTWLNLQGSQLWILRGGLAFLGFVGAGTFLWFHREKTAATLGGSDSSGTAEIDLLVREAVRRLKDSTLGRGATLGKLPVVFLLGDSGSTKTTTIIHSSLDPELLSGHVYQDNNILPTRVSNIWYTRQAVFVDPAGDFLGQPNRWKRLVKLLRPGRLSTAMGKGRQAPRAAIVCFDCSSFLQPGASESTLSAARKLAARLQEISQLLSISFPVYVLFTKLDKVSFFQEFARGLSKEDASEVLGATLPVRSLATGVYAEEETKRLTKAFDDLFYALADRRLDLLAREHEIDKLPGIYEFPRELRKLRTLLVQFLVDLARPSQLSVNPFLRGFYFSGVRPVLVADVVPAAPQAQASEAKFDAGATRIFGGVSQGPQAVPTRSAGSRKVPQWVFLTRLFNDVIVKDRVALATSGISTRVNLLRRTALGFVVLVALVCTIGFVVSYVGNRALLSEVKSAQSDEVPAPSDQLPGNSDLQRLNATGQLLDRLGDYHQDGAPLSLRWGLYVGDSLYPRVCQTYARGLNQLLLDPARASMVAELRQFADVAPNQMQPSESQPEVYKRAYGLLKTYLIVTNQGSHAKEDSSFTSDLFDYCRGSRKMDSGQAAVVKEQLDRYAGDLANPATTECFASAPNETAVTNARAYINSFPPARRMYQAMLSEASKAGKAFGFEPYADEAVSDGHEVGPAFTKVGWSAMNDAMNHPEQYGGGEQWVLGEGTRGVTDPQNYVAELRQQYEKDFVSEWLAFIKEARFAAYRSPSDISLKIEKVAGAHSAMLMVLCMASTNTNVNDKEIAKAFSAPRGLVPADCENTLLGTANNAYTTSLFALRDCLDKVNRDNPDQKDSDRGPCADTASDVTHTVSKLVAENEGSDQVDKAVESLLSRPIEDRTLQSQLKAPPPPGAEGLCNVLKRLGEDFPKGNNTFDKLQDVFKPGGLLDQHSPPPTNPNPRYFSFFNKAKDIQKALYPDGKTLQLHYTITALPSGDLSFNLLTATASLSTFKSTKDFVWTGDPQERVQLNVSRFSQEEKTGSSEGSRNKSLEASKTGSLAIFQFVSELGEGGQLNGSNYNFDIEMIQALGHQTASEQKLKFVINAGAASQLFQRGSLGTLGCTSKTGQ